MKRNFTLYILFIFLYFSTSLHGVIMKEGSFIKEKKELEILKKNLDTFYKQKEIEYKKQLQELQSIQKEIKKDLETIDITRKKNQEILDEIDQKITSKSIRLYEKMKVKLVYTILQEKIDNGNIKDVFDIMIRLKEKRVMKLLKLFDTKTATDIMNMMSKNKNKE